MRSVLTLFDLTTAEIDSVLTVAEKLKSKLAQQIRQPLLTGRVMGLLFEKPSLRTRVSFEAAMTHLGGGSVFLGEDVGWKHRESASDFARVLSEYVDVIACRAKNHGTVEELAKYSSCPVINGLTDLSHPCQALADLFTMRERSGPLAGQKLAYVGDANNVARSLAVACGKLGVQFSIASPVNYQFDDAFIQQLKSECSGVQIEHTTDPFEAVADASAVYTDVWASMGQEGERNQRANAFASFQVNDRLMSRAPKDACFLHCLPARRGEEVTDDVIDGAQSAVVQQAANRMHVQKGLLAWLLGASESA